MMDIVVVTLDWGVNGKRVTYHLPADCYLEELDIRETACQIERLCLKSAIDMVIEKGRENMEYK